MTEPIEVWMAQLKVPYKIVSIKFEDLKSEPFVSLNPNGRAPAIKDPNTDLVLWESGAIISYLIEQYDTAHVLSYDTLKEKQLCNQWLHFQMSGQGPYFGQAGWFTVLHQEKLPSAIERYRAEIKRILGVLEKRLEGRQWLVGDKMTYADLAWAPWNDRVDVLLSCPPEEKFEGFPAVKAWHDRVTSRPSWKKAMEERARLMDEQGLTWTGMPKGIQSLAEYQEIIDAKKGGS
ncbi:Transcriptional regulator ure2 [Diatrype stigma]|uniref:glutathione transferase n=1 Tax=Diatrype stigma TaxID=117547 RepID=A0AAN9UZR7_9PEZI